MPDHVHSRFPSRCCDAEPTEEVLAKLNSIKPHWEPFRRDRRGVFDANRHDVTRETKAEFDKRLACWEAAMAQELARRA